jgi:hypothetical protein
MEWKNGYLVPNLPANWYGACLVSTVCFPNCAAEPHPAAAVADPWFTPKGKSLGLASQGQPNCNLKGKSTPIASLHLRLNSAAAVDGRRGPAGERSGSHNRRTSTQGTPGVRPWQLQTIRHESLYSHDASGLQPCCEYRTPIRHGS